MLKNEIHNGLGADIQATEMREMSPKEHGELHWHGTAGGCMPNEKHWYDEAKEMRMAAIRGVFPYIQDSGERREFETGAVRDIQENKGRYDLIPWEAIHELALHCEAGALKYGERNAELGIPLHSFIDSAMRHLSCYLRGMNDEPHLRAALWNIAFAIWTEKNMPDMQDIPARKGYV